MASVCPGTINSPICGGIFEYDDRRRGLFSRLSRIVTVHGIETLKNFQALARYAFTGCRRCKAPGVQAYYYSYFKCPGTKQMRYPVNAYPGSASNRPLRVQFGRRTRKRFSHFREAERFLDGLRWEVDQGTYDPRDYRISNPLGFETLARKWLSVKIKEVKPKSYNNLRNYMEKAISAWGQMNVKTIGYGEIEDFLHSQKVSDKTKPDMKSGLHSFYTWIKKREKILMPNFPEVSFELGWRKIIDKETQESILDEVYRISHHINPKIWLGIKWLSTYISIRPGELLKLNEEDIDVRLGYIIVIHPKEKRPKLVPLIDEDIEILKNMPRGFPKLPFFRHAEGISGAPPGKIFGNKYFYKWWLRACSNLNVENVDLYGGTRHSTATALREKYSL